MKKTRPRSMRKCMMSRRSTSPTSNRTRTSSRRSKSNRSPRTKSKRRVKSTRPTPQAKSTCSSTCPNNSSRNSRTKKRNSNRPPKNSLLSPTHRNSTVKTKLIRMRSVRRVPRRMIRPLLKIICSSRWTLPLICRGNWPQISFRMMMKSSHRCWIRVTIITATRPTRIWKKPNKTKILNGRKCKLTRTRINSRSSSKIEVKDRKSPKGTRRCPRRKKLILAV